MISSQHKAFDCGRKVIFLLWFKLKYDQKSTCFNFNLILIAWNTVIFDNNKVTFAKNKNRIFMLRFSLILCICSLIAYGSSAQTIGNKSAKVASIGFYNLENLYDTVDDTLINDEEFLPNGARAWTQQRYIEKVANMAKVISQIGTEKAPAGLSVLGVAEIENRKVLQDVANDPLLKSRHYKIIQFNSPDKRGVDVGMFYNPTHFTPIAAVPIPLINLDNGERLFTRDILYVKGLLDDDTLHIMVNHWPSRSGGEARTAPYRNNAAKLCRRVMDSIMVLTPEAKIIIMGDLNDDPTSESMKAYLRCVDNIKDVNTTGVFNPFEDMYRRGVGSNAYQDTWSLFDQIVISKGLAPKDPKGFSYAGANVFNKQFLIQSAGQYKGYPFRTFSGDSYQSGYSDHFPTCIYLTKKL